jgi:hypothetical protein
MLINVNIVKKELFMLYHFRFTCKSSIDTVVFLCIFQDNVYDGRQFAFLIVKKAHNNVFSSIFELNIVM